MGALDDWDRRGVTVVVTVVGAGLALVNPAAGFAGAVAAPLILDYLSERERAKARNVEVLVEKAIARAGLTPEGFLEKIKADDVKLALLREALEACWSSYDLQKSKLLSLAVAQGVNDGTRVDVSRLLVATFRDLEAIHLQVLSHFEQVNEPINGGHLVTRFPGLQNATEAVTSALHRHGCLAISGIDGGDIDTGHDEQDTFVAWSITGYGRKCLDHLSEANGTQFGI